MGSISILGVKSKSLLQVERSGHVQEERATLLVSRYQQLELKDVFDKGVCGAIGVQVG